jgi:hypothetical protein
MRRGIATMSMRAAHSVIGALVVFGALASVVSAQDDLKLDYHGAGWVQIGRIEESFVGTDFTNDYNDNWMQSSGSQLSVNAKFGPEWDGALSVGVVGVHLARGAVSEIDRLYPFWVAYVGEARVTWTHPVFESGKFQLSLGAFPYNYSADAKNLGVYLMRGYVYPGTLESGFGNVMGGQARYAQGKFRNDLILKSEDQKPIYDLSLIDVVNYEVTPGFEVGAGVNFYRLVAQNDDLTNPGLKCGGVYGQCFYEDTTGVGAGGEPDTITGSLAGTKLMARFHLDPKVLFGMGTVGSLTLGKQDLVLYGEAALLGIKDYPIYYDDKLRRIPVMLGFNLPVFGALDFLSLEVEYYASKNSSNTVGAAFGGAWVPDFKDDPDVARYAARDDWKWSVNAAKTLFGNAQLSAQVANDHLRPGGSHDVPWVGKEAMRTPKDWYWTCKLAYFF